MLGRLFGFPDAEGRRELDKVFAGRETLTPEQFYLRYFQSQGFDQDLVMRIKAVFDRNIDFDLSRLSQTDDFSKELRFLWDYDSLASVNIVIDLEKEFGAIISDAEAESMKTIQDVVEIIVQKVGNRRIQPSD